MLPIRRSLLPALLLLTSFLSVASSAQDPAAASKVVTVRGSIVPHPDFRTSWTGQPLELPPQEMTARLRQYVDLPLPPLPEGFETWTPDRQQKWEEAFVATEAGQQHLQRNQELLAAAHSFDIKFEENGTFVIYDVPPGDYAIQGRQDKTIGDIAFAFEVFGQLQIRPDVEVVKLAPIVIEVTPLLKRGQTAPPLELPDVQLQGKQPRLINFWSSASPAVQAQQAQVQAAAAALADQGLQLVSINVDAPPEPARQLAGQQGWDRGEQVYLGTLQHQTLYHYGVRGVPAWWLLDAEGQVLRTPGDLMRGVQNGQTLTALISAALAGEESPTPASPSNPGN